MEDRRGDTDSEQQPSAPIEATRPNPYDPPTTPLAHVHPAAQNAGLFASVPLWRRFFAFVVDALALWLIVFVGGWIAMGFLILSAKFAEYHGLAVNDTVLMCEVMAFFLALLGIAVLYFAIPEGSRYGASLGKRLFSIQVVGLDGRRISRWRSAYRTLIKFVSLILWGIGAVWLLCNPRRQALHDQLAGTRVIRARSLVDLNIPDNFNTADFKLEPWMFD